MTKTNSTAIYNAAHEVMDTVRQIVNGITVSTTHEEVRLGYDRKSYTGRRRLSTHQVTISRWPADPAATTEQWMVSVEKDETSLCNTLHDAVENGIGELVHAVLLKEFEEFPCVEDTEEWRHQRECRP